MINGKGKSDTDPKQRRQSLDNACIAFAAETVSSLQDFGIGIRAG
jgi:hypothetical protein